MSLDKVSWEEREITFNFSEDQRAKFAFIKGDSIEFARMITNAIKNGVEAREGEAGEIDVREIVKLEEVEIRVKDNGQGMPKEMVEKIEKWGKGKLKIESKEGEGTEFILRFKKVDRAR
ncbi:MAG: ATP-binding protein [Endomicrobium sp.]|jgi:signal transduction histidine kinase|nr:ATP-binding protein [Endomicrobium sp.]